MFRGIRLSAAWLGCAAGLLLHVGTVHAATHPLTARDTPTTVPAPAAAGVLRVLAVSTGGAVRDQDSERQTRRMLGDFARALGRRLEWSEVARPDERFERLATGSADIVVGAGPADLNTRPSIVATSPVATERYVVVGRRDNRARNPLELAGMSVAMALASPHWDYFERVRKVVPGMELHALSNDLERAAPLRLVADGMVDLAVVAITGSQDWLAAHPRVEPLFNLTAERPLSWYVRRDNSTLLSSLNQFIERYHAAYFEPSAMLRDFAAIKQRGVLRVITRVESSNYFIREGKPSGFELELAAAFARRHRLRLEVRVANDEQQIFDWLAKGIGDLVTTRVVSREAGPDAAFAASRAYHYDAYATVSRRALPLRSAADLAGLVFAAPEQSAAFRALQSMREGAEDVTVIPVSAEVSEAVLLDRVAQGVVDATVVTGQAAARIAAQYPALFVGTSIAHRYDYQWTVRSGDAALLTAVNGFLRAAQTTGLTPQLAARYGSEDAVDGPVAATGSRLSPYDPLVQHYADRYGFDWRLIAAQMYQESQFDPRAVSPSGARGLMQLMPSTAQSLGFADVGRPDSAIHAGVKYLYELRKEFDAEVPVGERTWFALAAYNLGPQRVERARRLAARLKLDPNRWAGNVEFAMLRLARPSGGGTDRRYGQALIYVRAIQSLYGSYRSLLVSAAPTLPGVPRA